MIQKFAVVVASSLMVASVSCVAAFAAQTIVGRWRPVDGACRPSSGEVAIGPMTWVEDESTCDFTDVSRKMDVVKWKGTCNYATGESWRVTVTASLENRVLKVRFNNGDLITLVRCR